MSKLAEGQCEACRVGAPEVTDEELAELRPEIPDWELVVLDGERQLRREFGFKNFAEAMAFANRVGELAEAHNHHPALLVEWGKVTVRWWTHKIHGLHKNDCVMAAKTDRLL
jgi:4a-hydroxytetrahydrobiopterin dehydratase